VVSCPFAVFVDPMGEETFIVSEPGRWKFSFVAVAVFANDGENSLESLLHRYSRAPHRSIR